MTIYKCLIIGNGSIDEPFYPLLPEGKESCNWAVVGEGFPEIITENSYVDIEVLDGD